MKGRAQRSDLSHRKYLPRVPKDDHTNACYQFLKTALAQASGRKGPKRCRSCNGIDSFKRNGQAAYFESYKSDRPLYQA